MFNPVFVYGWGCVPSLLYDLRPNYGGGNEDNGNFFQKVPCNPASLSAQEAYTQICCTQNPCPCSRPLLTCSFSGGTQTQFWLSLYGISGFWYAQGLFDPSEHLLKVRSLTLNSILPLLCLAGASPFTIRKIIMNQITLMVWLVTYSQKLWHMKSTGP